MLVSEDVSPMASGGVFPKCTSFTGPVDRLNRQSRLILIPTFVCQIRLLQPSCKSLVSVNFFIRYEYPYASGVFNFTRLVSIQSLPLITIGLVSNTCDRDVFIGIGPRGVEFGAIVSMSLSKVFTTCNCKKKDGYPPPTTSVQYALPSLVLSNSAVLGTSFSPHVFGPPWNVKSNGLLSYHNQPLA